MDVKDLKEKSEVDELIVQVMEKKEVIETDRYRTCDVVGEDKTGRVTVTLWNEQTSLFEEGDVIVVKKGWCKSYKDQLSVSSGKNGTIEKVD